MDDFTEENYKTEVIYGYKIKHYSNDEYLYDEFQPLEIRRDTILDKLAISERLIELYKSNTGNSPPDRCT